MDQAERISGEGAIEANKPGRMIYSRFHAGDEHWQTAFLTRGEPKYVPRDRNPTIEQPGGLMSEGDARLVATLLRFGAREEAQLYEAWFNCLAKNKKSFLDLANQGTFAVIWFRPERGRVSASDNIGQVM